MEIYRKLDAGTRPGSIVKRGNRYKYSNNGQELGTIIVTQAEAYKISNENQYQEIADKFGLPVEDIYVEDSLDSSLTYSTTSDHRYHMSVYKKVQVNELPYGVFELKYSMSDGNYLADYKSDMNDANIIPTHNLKELVMDFFENEVEIEKTCA